VCVCVCVCMYVKTHTYGHTHTHNDSGMEQARMKALKQGYGTGFELCFLCERVFVHVCTCVCMCLCDCVCAYQGFRSREPMLLPSMRSECVMYV
jgi:hypothetical protein